MKYGLKILLTFLLCIFSCTIAGAEEKSDSVWNSDNTDVFNKGFENQEPVSDGKLQKTIEQLKERSLTNKQKKMKEQVKPLSPSYDEEHFRNFADENAANNLSTTRTVLIPMSVYNENGTTIPPGYYKLSCRKTGDNDYVLELSQGTKVVLSAEAAQTKQDLEQESINFCNAEIISDNRIRLMYGSIELNLVAYLYFK